MKKAREQDYPVFYQTYTKKIDDNIEILDFLDEKLRLTTIAFIESLSESQLQYSYGQGKWTLANVLGHIIDCERIFAYRSLAFVRKDQTPLPAFDENEYAINSNYTDLDSKSILHLYHSNRNASSALFRTYKDSMWDQSGMANGKPMIALAIPYIIAGHEIHHITVIKNKYL